MHRRHALLLDAALPVVVGAVIVVGSVLHGGASTGALPMVVALAAAGTLWARRRAPGWTLAVSGALVAVLFHIDHPAGAVAVLAPAVALYSLALSRGRAQQLLAAAAAVAAVIVADASHSGPPTMVQTLGHAMLVAIPLLGAEAMRTHQSYLSLVSERLDLAERTREQEAQRRAEQERMRIARELHDVVAHTLTTINVQAGAAAERLGAGDARKALETIEDASHEAIGELRAVLGVLRARDDAEAPLAPAPGVENLPELLHRVRDAGLAVELHSSGDPPSRLSDAVSLAAYRIVQESLTNAQRHAAGAAVRIRLSFDAAGLAITVENGAGMRLSGNSTAPGVGIAGMLERASATGGTLRAGPSEEGFRVQAELPYEPSR